MRQKAIFLTDDLKMTCVQFLTSRKTSGNILKSDEVNYQELPEFINGYGGQLKSTFSDADVINFTEHLGAK